MKQRLDGRIYELQSALNKFQDALGLKLEVIDDSHVRYIFVCIDPSAHDRTFSVATKFNEGEGLFGMSRSNPQRERYCMPRICNNSNRLYPTCE